MGTVTTLNRPKKSTAKPAKKTPLKPIPIKATYRSSTTLKKEKWTDERMTVMRVMWNSGKSAATIAAAFGGPDAGFTKNAVIGKIQRSSGFERPVDWKRNLGGRPPLYGPDNPRPKRPRSLAMPGHSTVRSVARTSERREAQKLLIQEGAKELQGLNGVVEVPLAERRNIITVLQNQCRWCIGDPASPDFHFCNRQQIPGLTYCELHAGIVYNIVPRVASSPKPFFKK